MLTSQKVIDATNEPAFAEPPSRKRYGVPGATAWQADPEFAGLHLRNPR
jgi:hypothetical protein